MSITIEDVEVYLTLKPRLASSLSDFSTLSKSKPDAAINRFKLGFVNELLAKLNALIGVVHKPLDDFEVFSDEELPSNSDVVYVLSQYSTALTAWRSANVRKDGTYTYWDIEGKYIRV